MINKPKHYVLISRGPPIKVHEQISILLELLQNQDDSGRNYARTHGPTAGKVL